jgi:glycosyltransferase involved in cell wall biosynthesis
MRNVSIDVIEPTISDKFSPLEFPVKPVITVHTREQRETINLIKTFYQKYPQYRWINFRDMRGLSESEFANALKDSMVSIWIDPTSSFGTYPLESMKCNVPVIGRVPNMVPEWMSENNGIWLQESLKTVDVVAEYIQNWLEDNVSEELYSNGIETAKQYSNKEMFNDKVNSLFEGYAKTRIGNFQQELNKLSTVEN